jgi:hypothetical protein
MRVWGVVKPFLFRFWVKVVKVVKLDSICAAKNDVGTCVWSFNALRTEIQFHHLHHLTVGQRCCPMRAGRLVNDCKWL